MGLGRSVLFRVATSERLERAVKRAPGGEHAAWRSASRYVASRSLGGAVAAVEMLLERGHGASVDLFGERVSDPAIADKCSRTTSRSSPPCRHRRRTLAVRRSLAPGAWRRRGGRHPAPRGDCERSARRPAHSGRRRRGRPHRCRPTLRHRRRRTGPGRPARSHGASESPALPSDTDALADAGCTSGSSRALTSSRPAPTHYGEPTDVAFVRLGFRLAERGAAWSMATHDGRVREALLLAHGPCRSSSCSACARRFWTSCTTAASPPRLRALRRRLVPVLDATPRRVPRHLTRNGDRD